MVNIETRRKISYASSNNKPISIKTYTFLPKAQTYIDHFLTAFLEEAGLSPILDQLSFCIKELAVNAKKANFKRVYFLDKGLNINDPEEYRKGMSSFKSEIIANQAHYLRRVKEMNLYVKIEFLTFQGLSMISVKNNSILLDSEHERILDKINKAKGYESLEEAFDDVKDDTEGSGLGILVLILMLRNVGLTGDFFKVSTKAGETVARISLPHSKAPPAP